MELSAFVLKVSNSLGVSNSTISGWASRLGVAPKKEEIVELGISKDKTRIGFLFRNSQLYDFLFFWCTA